MVRQWVVMVISFATGVLALSVCAEGTSVSWNGSSGLLPWDPSIPSNNLFTVTGPTSDITLVNDYLHIDTQHKINVRKTDCPTVNASDWRAVDIELRMNSYYRNPSLNWGAGIGMANGGGYFVLLVSGDKVGFAGYNADSYIDGLYYSMDTTNAFHDYLITDNGTYVDLFIDGNPSPRLQIPIGDFLGSTGNTLYLAGTSESGFANFDVSSFTYTTDLATAPVPEPVTMAGVLLGVVGLSGYIHKRVHHR